MEFYNKDVQILRQSQIKLALEYLQYEGIHVTIKELQQITDVFVELTLRPMDKDLKDRVKALDNWLKEKKDNGTN